MGRGGGGAGRGGGGWKVGGRVYASMVTARRGTPEFYQQQQAFYAARTGLVVGQTYQIRGLSRVSDRFEFTGANSGGWMYGYLVNARGKRIRHPGSERQKGPIQQIIAAAPSERRRIRAAR